MAATTHSFPLPTSGPSTDGQDNSSPDTPVDGNAAGASGASTGGFELSRGGLAAIIVVVSIVAILGIAMTILFYIAKKREWTIRETIRRSAKKVVTVLTPRRSEFPRSVKESVGRGGRVKLDEVPPTPRIKPEQLDLEKGADKPDKKRYNFSRK